eukprot:4395452-Pleurochrysis_carterae.AAC.1
MPSTVRSVDCESQQVSVQASRSIANASLAVHALLQSPRPMGARLHLQLDNTCGENKNATVIDFLAWLVLNDVFHEAGFFCMMKGHTYSILDQSFSTFINKLHQYAIYTISSLLAYMRYLLG